MRGYRCYYVDAKDHITGVEQVAAEDDGAAIQSARGLLRAKQFVGVGVELWEGKRRVWRSRDAEEVTVNPHGETDPRHETMTD